MNRQTREHSRPDLNLKSQKKALGYFSRARRRARALRTSLRTSPGVWSHEPNGTKRIYVTRSPCPRPTVKSQSDQQQPLTFDKDSLLAAAHSASIPFVCFPSTCSVLRPCLPACCSVCVLAAASAPMPTLVSLLAYQMYVVSRWLIGWMATVISEYLALQHTVEWNSFIAKSTMDS